MSALKKILAVVALASVLGMSLAAYAKEGVPTGSVSIDSTQIGFIVSGQWGGGKLYFKKKTYPFKLGGLGIGGLGATKIKATGTVYDLQKLEDFPGTYVQGRIGFAFSDQGKGDLWLKSDKGVVLQLKTKQSGLALTAGADGVQITMDK